VADTVLDFERLGALLNGALPPQPKRVAKGRDGGGEQSATRPLAVPPGVIADPDAMRLAQAGKAFLATVAERSAGACSNCGGTGLIFVRTILGGPFQSPPGSGEITWEHGPGGEGWYAVDTVSRPCPVCSNGADARQAAVRRLRKTCGLRDEELGFRLDFLERLAKRLGRPELLAGKQEALRVMGEMVAALPDASGMVFLYGPPGVGKSGLAMAYVAAAVSLGVRAAYVTAPDLIKARRATMNGAPDPLPALLDAPVLVLDEVDRVGTEWERGELFSVVDARTRARHRAATVLVSNRTPDELAGDGFGYLVSRLLHGEVVAMGGADVRRVVV